MRMMKRRSLLPPLSRTLLSMDPSQQTMGMLRCKTCQRRPKSLSQPRTLRRKVNNRRRKKERRTRKIRKSLEK
jgi:hypothetical protein